VDENKPADNKLDEMASNNSDQLFEQIQNNAQAKKHGQDVADYKTDAQLMRALDVLMAIQIYPSLRRKP
jgi:ABC-type transporter MlaC component